MKPMITRVHAGARTDTTLDLEIHLQNREVISLHLNAEGAAAIIAAIVEHCPPDPTRSVDFPCYGFGTTLSVEGHTVLGFQLSANRYPITIRVPQEKLLEVRAGIAKWETQRPGRA
jgi:hypothetical protein